MIELIQDKTTYFHLETMVPVVEGWIFEKRTSLPKRRF